MADNRNVDDVNDCCVIDHKECSHIDGLKLSKAVRNSDREVAEFIRDMELKGYDLSWVENKWEDITSDDRNADDDNDCCVIDHKECSHDDGLKLSKAVRNSAREVDEFIANIEPKEYKDGWSEDKWEEEMEKHPFFATGIKDGEELPPLVEALQSLKHSPEYNSPTELAMAYKVDGNERFKKEHYKYAILTYTEGLNCKCEDDDLNSVLYCNRAAAHYHMGHYRKALNDAAKCMKLDPANIKAHCRSALCYFSIGKYEDCLTWCEDGLKIEGENKAILELKEKALKTIESKHKLQEKEEEKKQALEVLNNAIRERGINLIKSGITEDTLEYDYLGLSVAKVHMTDENVLIWPVVVHYPQFGTTDFIPTFNEKFCFFEYFMELLSEPSPRDVKLEYTAENVKVYFFDSKGYLVPVNEMDSLKSIMQSKRFKVTAGYLTFFVTSSQFDQRYRDQNTLADF